MKSFLKITKKVNNMHIHHLIHCGVILGEKPTEYAWNSFEVPKMKIVPEMVIEEVFEEEAEKKKPALLYE